MYNDASVAKKIKELNQRSCWRPESLQRASSVNTRARPTVVPPSVKEAIIEYARAIFTALDRSLVTSKVKEECGSRWSNVCKVVNRHNASRFEQREWRAEVRQAGRVWPSASLHCRYSRRHHILWRRHSQRNRGRIEGRSSCKIDHWEYEISIYRCF